MTLDELLHEWEMHKPDAVLVTGPQRSGTTIAAHILANALGYRYVDEEAIGVHNAELAERVLRRGRVVLQAPGLCHLAHALAAHPAVVVLMRRRLEDIHRSEERIGWRTAYGGLNLRAEQVKYFLGFGIPTNESTDIAQVKYRVWEEVQKTAIPAGYAFELAYESMQGHSYFKDANQRARFTSRQWVPTPEAVPGGS